MAGGFSSGTGASGRRGTSGLDGRVGKAGGSGILGEEIISPGRKGSRRLLLLVFKGAITSRLDALTWL